MKLAIKILLAGMLCLMGVACSDSPDPERDAPDPEAQMQGEAADQAIPVSVETTEELPRGIVLTFQHVVRQARDVEVKSGEFQRRIWVEYIGLEKDQVLAALDADMRKSGFVQEEAFDLPDGGRRTRFRPENGSRVSATVREGGELRVPGASGTIQFNIPIREPADY